MHGLGLLRHGGITFFLLFVIKAGLRCLHFVDGITGISHDAINRALSALLDLIKVILSGFTLLIDLLVNLFIFVRLSLDMLGLNLCFLDLFVLLLFLLRALFGLLDHISLALLAAAADRSELLFVDGSVAWFLGGRLLARWVVARTLGIKHFINFCGSTSLDLILLLLDLLVLLFSLGLGNLFSCLLLGTLSFGLLSGSMINSGLSLSIGLLFLFFRLCLLLFSFGLGSGLLFRSFDLFLVLLGGCSSLCFGLLSLRFCLRLSLFLLCLNFCTFLLLLGILVLCPCFRFVYLLFNLFWVGMFRAGLCIHEVVELWVHLDRSTHAILTMVVKLHSVGDEGQCASHVEA